MARRRVSVRLGFPKKCVAGLQGVCARGWCVGRAVGRLTVAAGLLVAAGAGCGGLDVDIAEALQVTEVTTGWFDAGIVQGGRNRLVPTISFRLENTTDIELRHVQVTGVFRRMGEEEVWGDAFNRAIGTEGLLSRALTAPIVLQSDLGYTGEQPRLEMFEHREFVDARVGLFVKHGGRQLVKLSEFPIERQLLTH
jgi:hypothetical protein